MFKLPNYTLKQFMCIAIIGSMMMMESIDTNILTVAIPSIAANLGTTPLNVKLAIVSYLVSLSIFIPISGYLSDKFGSKNILLISIAGFGFSSLLCGLSSSLIELVIFRFVQGIFGALTVPVGRLLMLKVFSKQELVKVFMLISMPLLLGPLLAPYLGGLLVSYYSWHYIFYVNIPFSLLALLATFRFVDNYRQEVKKFNWKSFIALGVFLAILAFWLDTALDIKNAYVHLIYILLILVTLIIYLKIELNSSNRIVNYKLFKIKSYNLCFWSSAISRITFGAKGFVLILYLQLALKITPLESGFITSWMALGYLFSRIAVSKLLKYLGFKKMLTICNIGTFISMLMFCLIDKTDTFAIIVIVANGFFSAVIPLLIYVLCYADVPSEDYASATGLMSITQQLFFAAGVTFAAACIFMCNKIYGVSYGNQTFMTVFVLIAIIGLMGQLCFNKLSAESGEKLANKKSN